jgi:hypothetical protein
MKTLIQSIRHRLGGGGAERPLGRMAYQAYCSLLQGDVGHSVLRRSRAGSEVRWELAVLCSGALEETVLRAEIAFVLNKNQTPSPSTILLIRDNSLPKPRFLARWYFGNVEGVAKGTTFQTPLF